MPRLLELLGLDEENLHWQDLAACQGMDTEWFYDDFEDDIQLAKQVDAVCFSCPVQRQCLKAGETNKEEGQWGGFYLINGKPDRIRNKHKTEEQQEWYDSVH